MSNIEGRERGATARIQFEAAPFPAGPIFYAQYQLDGQSSTQGVLVCSFLEPMSVGGMVVAHVWTHGTQFDREMFAGRRNFRLYAGEALIARGTMIAPPPPPQLDPPFLSTSGLPFDF